MLEKVATGKKQFFAGCVISRRSADYGVDQAIRHVQSPTSRLMSSRVGLIRAYVTTAKIGAGGPSFPTDRIDPAVSGSSAEPPRRVGPPVEITISENTIAPKSKLRADVVRE